MMLSLSHIIKAQRVGQLPMMIWKGHALVTAQFEVLSYNFPGGTKENNKQYAR
jgi:hypothetical protein